MSTAAKTNSKYLAYVVCGLATMFYVYEFFLRVMPSAMTRQLMHDFSIDAAGLGFMLSLFYYGYTPMQLPVGLLYDRFGPRKLLIAATTICTFGAFAFAMTDIATVASLSRFLIGFASAFAFVGALVLASRWFDAKYFAMIAGLVQMLGCIGAIVGEEPIALVIEHVSWQSTMIASGVFGIVLVIVMWFFLHDHPANQPVTEKENERMRDTLKKLVTVCKKPQTWWIGVYAFASWAPVTVFATLWGVPFVSAAMHTDNATAAQATSIVWVAIGIGSPLVGWWSNRIGSRRIPLALCAILGLISSLAILYIPNLSWWWMGIGLFVLGLASSGQALSFGVVQDNHEASVAGTALGFNNMAVVAGGIFFQPLVGYLLDAGWSGKMFASAPVYSFTNYQVALAVIPIIWAVGLLMSLFFIRETKCQSVY